MINVQQFQLDITQQPLTHLNVVNGDTANQFVIKITNDGESVSLDSTLHKIVAVFHRADGQVYTQDADSGVSFTTSGVVTVDVRPASFRTGTNTICLQIYKRENSSATEYPLLLTTQEQRFNARSAAIPESGSSQSEPQMPMLEKYVQDAKSWAVGGTGKREGEDADNSKFYSDMAQEAVEQQVVSPSITAWMTANYPEIADDMADDISAWLAEHMTNPSNPAIDTSLSVSGAAADANVTGNVKRTVDGSLLYSPSQDDFETGRLTPSNGTPASSAGTVVYNGTTLSLYGIRSKTYLDKSIRTINTDGTYYAFLLAYNASDAYVGWYNGTAFVTTAFAATKQSYDFGSLISAHSTYNYRLVVFDVSTAEQPSVANTVKNIGYFYQAVSENTLAAAINTTVSAKNRWVNGKLSSTGNDSSTGNANQIRTVDFIKINADKFILTVPLGYVAQYYIYDGQKSFVSRSSNVREKTVEVEIQSGYYIRLTAFNTSQSAISPMEGNGIILSYDESYMNAVNDANYTIDENTTLALFETVGVIGDSFASGELHDSLSGSYIGTNYSVSWGQIIARRNGLDVYNYSSGGLTTETWLADTNRGLQKLLADEAKELYLIALGINDKTAIDGGTESLGTIADIDTSDFTQNPNTFYGNYGRIIGNIKVHAPNAKIVLLSVARLGERTMDDHIKAIAALYGIPFVQLTEDSFFTSPLYYGSIVNGHPLAYGYAGMAKAIERLLCKCMIDNQYYFCDYTGM